MVDISRFYWLYQTYNLFNVLVVIPDAISQCIFTAARSNVPEMRGYVNIHCKIAGYWQREERNSNDNNGGGG